jgi:hypothetical protein
METLHFTYVQIPGLTHKGTALYHGAQVVALAVHYPRGGAVLDRDDLISIPRGGDVAGVSRPTMLVLALEGRVRSEKIAGRLLVSRSDCERVRIERARAAEARAARQAVAV